MFSLSGMKVSWTAIDRDYRYLSKVDKETETHCGLILDSAGQKAQVNGPAKALVGVPPTIGSGVCPLHLSYKGRKGCCFSGIQRS